MSWYSSPIQPLDPVVVSQTPKPPFRYMRDNFTATGQNSYVKAPSQDQSMWQALTNVMPITEGGISPRWGSGVFGGEVWALSNRLYNYQSDALGTRTIITTSVNGVAGYNEDGTLYNRSIFTPVATSGIIRSLTSRNYQYFCDGNNGLITGGATGSISLITYASGFRIPYNTNAVVTTSSTLGLVVGQTVTIFGNSNSDFNGTFLVTAVQSSTVFQIQFSLPNTTTQGTGGAYESSTFHRTGDSVKWNGAAVGGVTNIGINVSDVVPNTTTGGNTGALTDGPNTGSATVDVPYTTYNYQTQAPVTNPWTNPDGCFGNSQASPAYAPVQYGEYLLLLPGSFVATVTQLTTDTLQLTGFDFNAFTAPTVLGVQVDITYKCSLPYNGFVNPYGSMVVQLLKNGEPVGDTSNATIAIDGNWHTLQYGNASYLFGNSFVPSDIINSEFGVQFYATGGGTCTTKANNNLAAGYTVNVAYVTITVFGSASSGTSNNSGGGVGIVGPLAEGGINLVIGRTYYLVANNPLTGHFSDLSPPSASSGPTAGASFELVLATFNDPQAQDKYVLATADGGDPSILYQVPVITGTYMSVTSWSVTSNVITFTGTYSAGQFTVGSVVTVQGLVTGAYLTGIPFTVTSASTTTFTANYTTANASATEDALAGVTTLAVPNGTTTVIDSNPDPFLVLQQPMLYTDTSGNEYGVTLNDPPPAGTLILKHQGRLWMAGVPGSTHSVYFSKSVTELTLPNGFVAGKYEEAWPGSNYFDVSDGAESVSGLLTDGTTLYIGTQNHIRRLIGNAPSNFQEPQIVHPEVGLINQEVWQITFMQGAPAGSIWMTPDNKVIQSDFNTYVDIGTPVQNILNNLQSTAPSLAHAAYVADGEYDLYILAVPYTQSTYCDTHLVFDLRARQWFVWQPAGGSLALMYNVTQAAASQWLFINAAYGGINIYSPSYVYDLVGYINFSGQVTQIPVTAQTTWLHLGEPTRRKMLNEIQVYGNTEMTMNVYGANNLADFTNPLPVVYNRNLKFSPFGTWDLYLSTARTKHRYYQFTFNGLASAGQLLGSYAISTMPLDDL